MKQSALICGLLLITGGPLCRAAGPAEPTETDGRTRQRSVLVQRKEVFEFARPPAVRKLAQDSFEITFASRDWCDVAVAIEDADGKILRHLAAGLLGPTAPAPLVRDSLAQRLTWDGKDDWGKYVEGRDRVRVRVSLGLDAKFDYVASDASSYNNAGSVTAVGADADGVYVLTASFESVVRMFDHDGKYVRTVYPFPADKVAKFYRDPAGSPQYSKPGPHDHFLDTTHGLPFESYPDGTRTPAKGYGQFGDYTGIVAGGEATAYFYSMAVSKGRIVLPSHSYGGLVCFATDGGPAGDLPLFGPRVLQTSIQEQPVPRHMAASPDGQWLYLAGFQVLDAKHQREPTVLHGVYRIPFAADPPKIDRRIAFVGEGVHATDGPDGLNSPGDVATDSAGNLYVCDTGNDRLSVFGPDAKVISNVPVKRPLWVDVSPTTGEIYVLSLSRPQTGSNASNGRFELLKLSALPKAQVLIRQEFAFTMAGKSVPMVLRMDFWAKRPTAWLTTAPGALKLYEDQQDKFVLKRDFREEAAAGVRGAAMLFGADADNPPPLNDPTQRCRPFFDPARNKLYRGDGSNFGWMRRYDAATGKLEAVVRTPFSAEDAAFDGRGYLNLRHTASSGVEQYVGRFDPATMAEVPFDYGEPVSLQWNRKLTGAIVTPMMSFGRFHDCGLAVNQFGDVFVQGKNAAGLRSFAGTRGITDASGRSNSGAATKLFSYTYWIDAVREDKFVYVPGLYPGRIFNVANLVFVYSRKGELEHEDAVKGLTHASRCIGGDAKGNIFVGSCDTGIVAGKPYGHPFSGSRCVMYKFPPAGGRFIAPDAPPAKREKPDRPPDVIASFFSYSNKPLWVEGAEWLFPGVGSASHNGCRCQKYRFAVDYFGRVFAPEAGRYSIAVLDGSGMVIKRFGRYGNADSAGAASAVPIGGDEIALAHADHLAVATDNRLFAYDRWNKRMVGIKLTYHAERRVPLP